MIRVVFVAASLLFLVLAWITGPDHRLSDVFYLLSYGFGGWFGLLSALRSLAAKDIDIDLLMILAALGAAWIGAPAEGALLLFLFSLSNVLQEYAIGRTHRAIESLAKLKPASARKLANGSEPINCPLEEIHVGDQIRVLPGDLIPLDGSVVSGDSSVDESSVTGESIPVNKTTGAKVFAGSLNKNGSLTVQVERESADSTLARMISLVEHAREQKAQTQRMLEDFEKHYAAGVIVFTLLLIAVIPKLYGVSFNEGFYRAITVMVVASPCALIISTPASILSAIARGARCGILFKGGIPLERGARIRAIAFDKTGTLTQGRVKLQQIVTYHPDRSEADILGLAASIESHSEHPLAKAIVQEAHARGLSLPALDSFESTPGRGVTAKLDGRKHWVGRSSWLREIGVSIETDKSDELRSLQDEGFTAIGVAESTPDGTTRLLAWIALSDSVRPDAADTLRQLRQSGIHEITMLTGDNQRVARRIASELGIDTWHAALLPEDKVQLIRDLSKRSDIAMVGDGTNDAPALASANLGIAMGAAGSDVALESADIVLMASDLNKLPLALNICRATRRIVLQNLSFALGIIAIMVVLTLALPIWGIEVPLPIGVVAHEGGTVLVCLNGLRLLVGWHK